MKQSYHQRGVTAVLKQLAPMGKDEEFTVEGLAERLKFTPGRVRSILHTLLEEGWGAVNLIRGGELHGDSEGRVWYRETETWQVGPMRLGKPAKQPA